MMAISITWMWCISVTVIPNSQVALVLHFLKKALSSLHFFGFRYGYDIVNGTKMTTTNMNRFDNQSTAVLRRWRKEGDVTDIPRGIIGGG